MDFSLWIEGYIGDAHNDLWPDQTHKSHTYVLPEGVESLDKWGWSCLRLWVWPAPWPRPPLATLHTEPVTEAGNLREPLPRPGLWDLEIENYSQNQVSGELDKQARG